MASFLINCQDWTSKPLNHESPRITTRPGLVLLNLLGTFKLTFSHNKYDEVFASKIQPLC